MILLIDNYDSFVYNLARYLVRLGHATQVVRNDELSVQQVRALRPQAIVLSPGPCTPADAGISLDLVRTLGADIPLLGVCLGHQTIGAAFGGRIVRAPEPMHGRISQITHAGTPLFQDVPNPFWACRYHSLVIDAASLPECLYASAHTADGLVMAVEHRSALIMGLQFHPEAILTEAGYILLRNFLQRAGLPSTEPLPTVADELETPVAASTPLPTRPVTF